MRTAALGVYTYAEFGLFMLLFIPVMGVADRLHRDDPGKRVQGQWMRRFGRTTSNLTPFWHFSVEGEPPADIRSRAYVVVCNHESAADPFLLSHLPFDMRWIAKEELYKIPILGSLMTYGGDIPLRRGDGDSVREMIRDPKPQSRLRVLPFWELARRRAFVVADHFVNDEAQELLGEFGIEIGLFRQGA